MKKQALENIEELFEEAKKVFPKNRKFANRYVELARKISMKTRTRIPKHLKKRFCKHCYYYLQPGVNCRVRTRNKKIIYYCMNCKKFMRHGLG